MKTVVIVGTSSGLGFELRKILAETEIHLVTINRKSKPKNSSNTVHEASIIYDLQKGGFDISLVPEGLLPESNEVVLVLNAATVSPLGPALTHSAKEIEKSFKTNFFGYVSIIQSFVEATNTFNFELRIIGIGTGATSRIIPGWFIYSASKACLESYLQFVAFENPKVSVTNFRPGVFQSKIQDEIFNYNAGEQESRQILPPSTQAATKLANLILNPI
jgi:short-subunit dehydrogenase